MEYRNISNKDKGHSVRGKLNTMLSALIEGSEGVLRIWKKLLGIDTTLSQLEETVQNNYEDLRKGVTQANDYTDRKLAELRVSLDDAILRNKGYFPSLDALNASIPFSEEGCIAYVGTVYPYKIYRWQNSAWADTGKTGGAENLRLTDYYTKTEIDAKHGTNSVTTAMIAPLAVTTAEIRYGAVTSDRIAEGAVTTSKLTDKNVTSEKIADYAIGSGHIKTHAIKTDHLDLEAVTSEKIAEGAVTADKLPNGVISMDKLPDSTRQILLHDFFLGKDNVIYGYTSEDYIDSSEVYPFDRIYNASQMNMTIEAGSPPSGVEGEIVFLEDVGIFVLYTFMTVANVQFNIGYKTFPNSVKYTDSTSLFRHTLTDKVYNLRDGVLVPCVTGRKVAVVTLDELQNQNGNLRFSFMQDLSEESTWSIDETLVTSPMDNYRIVFDTRSARFMYSGPWVKGVPSLNLRSYPNFNIAKYGITTKMYAFSPYIEKTYLDDNGVYYQWMAGIRLRKLSNVHGIVHVTYDEYQRMVEANDVDHTVVYLIVDEEA